MSGKFTDNIAIQNGIKKIIPEVIEAEYIIICQTTQNLSFFLVSGVWYVNLDKASVRK
jgi:hypothetical protein